MQIRIACEDERPAQYLKRKADKDSKATNQSARWPFSSLFKLDCPESLMLISAYSNYETHLVLSKPSNAVKKLNLNAVQALVPSLGCSSETVPNRIWTDISQPIHGFANMMLARAMPGQLCRPMDAVRERDRACKAARRQKKEVSF